MCHLSPSQIHNSINPYPFTNLNGNKLIIRGLIFLLFGYYFRLGYVGKRVALLGKGIIAGERHRGKNTSLTYFQFSSKEKGKVFSAWKSFEGKHQFSLFKRHLIRTNVTLPACLKWQCKVINIFALLCQNKKYKNNNCVHYKTVFRRSLVKY